ncbi:unnamed protein product [Rotaria sordida]|uniref:Uncharacterized protein n=1 Tax=Rotaria sordida TaxID=392033 RepID=A0A814M7K9_9BILA|nr:unnamed protein product [Rotaria sordida]CAF1394681.1 unnamed protein product [Rotaria sordida]
MSNLSIRMINLHTFSLVQTFFSMLTIEWTVFEILTSSNVMPVLRRANVSLFININDLNCISSSGIFTDHRHVDVHFAFNLLNCSPYTKVTPCIPRGNRFHSREIVGATFVVNHWSPRSEWLIDSDPFSRGLHYYHHMWYTLPWTFDEFFHEYIPYRWITKVQVFEIPSHNTTAMAQLSLRTSDAAGQTLPSPIFLLPHVALSNYIETLHLSYYNRPINIHLSALRHATSSLRDFGFYFRRKFSSLDDDMKTTFEDHTKFIKQLCDQILLLCLDKQLHYSIEDDGCGLTMWF